MILCLARNSNTADSPMQRLPDVHQHTITIFVPLMIPKSQLLDALYGQKLFPLFIMHTLLRHAVLKAIKFNGQFCQRAVNIQEVFVGRMLPTELESGKTARPQCPP